MQLFNYAPQVTAGPNGTVIRHNDDENTPLDTVGEYGGRTVVIASDGATIPPQPTEIDWRAESDLQGWYEGTRYYATLESARQAKHRARNRMRVAKETEGFVYDGHLIDSDERSITRITNAATKALAAKAAGQPFTVDWLCADEAVLTLDADAMLAMQNALVAHGQQCHDESQAVKTVINQADTMSTLAAVEL